MTDFALARRNMVEGQLRPNRVTNAALLAAVGELPREKFLPEAVRSVAYADEDVPLGGGRYLMEPMVLARLIQTLQPQPEDRALVVGAGRGYGAALLARLVKAVTALESDPALAAAGEQTTRDLGLTGIQWVTGKLEQGGPGSAPYDVILIEGAVRQVPQAVFDQLAEGGRLAVTVSGTSGAMGVAQIFIKDGGVTSGRPLFEAGTPPLPGFAPPPRFTF
ncbi:MAG: protein-L-isoaspartate O-methyltransferase [Reyranella sp.]|uniref:protein-L-isoaspartate O-methyltransferase family protein n=1 Tax=Reyranella sp. TaxID=1929291 RepID=UPI00120D6EB8|nr:protein-L-isoaspartate O-methyltransferase [Reyranella sp.]TAJ38044.1 MAG: protein-L-isoaspartate O-methyltransferase [Reyranella sp.]